MAGEEEPLQHPQAELRIMAAQTMCSVLPCLASTRTLPAAPASRSGEINYLALCTTF